MHVGVPPASAARRRRRLPAWLLPCLPTSRPAASVEGYGEGATTLVSKEQFRFLVDEPPKLGGKGMGALPLLAGAGARSRRLPAAAPPPVQQQQTTTNLLQSALCPGNWLTGLQAPIR